MPRDRPNNALEVTRPVLPEMPVETLTLQSIAAYCRILGGCPHFSPRATQAKTSFADPGLPNQNTWDDPSAARAASESTQIAVASFCMSVD
jgi:hypothetical protein